MIIGICVVVITTLVIIITGVFDKHDSFDTNDSETILVINESSAKFQQFTYNDTATGNELEYSLFIPENYDSAKKYPLIMFIPDATGSDQSAKEIVSSYYGACIWATEEEQSKHESFVLVPAFNDKVVDDNWSTSDQIDAAVNLIDYLQNEYSIDSNRLYTTGQSMGCMTSLYINSQYPDLFAASLYVSGQWDISVLQPLENQKFFYVVAAGDEKASGGQNEVIDMMRRDNVSYTYDSWSAVASAEEQDSNVKAMIDENTDHYMISFKKGTVSDGEKSSGNEHMDSFNYAYKLSAVRDWLFEQSK